MGILSSILAFFGLVFFGGTGRGGRHFKGLFRTDGYNPFVSKPIKGHQDPWSKRRTGPRNPFIGRNRSFPPKSGGRNLPKDPWKKKYDSVMGGSSSKGYGASRSSGGVSRMSGGASRSTGSGRSRSATGAHYAHRSMFDTNDAIRARMEDMEQYYAQDKDFDAFDQGYEWDEIVDAANDGYLPEDYMDKREEEHLDRREEDSES